VKEHDWVSHAAFDIGHPAIEHVGKALSRAQALPTQRGDCDNFSALIFGGREDGCDIGHLREFYIRTKSSDPE